MDFEGFAANAADSAHVGRMREQIGSTLDKIEAALGKQPLLCGKQYTLADAFWTVAVARCNFLKCDPIDGGPALAACFERVQARPSFQSREVWESFQFSRILPILTQKPGPRLVLIFGVMVALWALLWWIL